MALGASAEKAVSIAMKFDLHTGGDVQTLRHFEDDMLVDGLSVSEMAYVLTDPSVIEQAVAYDPHRAAVWDWRFSQGGLGVSS